MDGHLHAVFEYHRRSYARATDTAMMRLTLEKTPKAPANGVLRNVAEETLVVHTR